jgi:peptidoglycan hydrolase-like protein with peptidoglycan-binding domain
LPNTTTPSLKPATLNAVTAAARIGGDITSWSPATTRRRAAAAAAKVAGVREGADTPTRAHSARSWPKRRRADRAA